MRANRDIRQPGPAPAERIRFARGAGRAVAFSLEGGVSLLEAARRRIYESGARSGVLEIEGGSFAPLRYVMPALSPSPSHAAYYSRTFSPPGECVLEDGRLTFGWRDGEPFLHCHAFWREPDGRTHGGHILPHEAIVGAPISARGWLLEGAAFETTADPETNFSLFEPRPAAPETPGRFYAMRLRPNIDICNALEHFCAERGIARAALRGGVGSIVGARFADGRAVEAFATEMFIREGRVAPGASGAPEALIDVALVDYLGGLADGVLARGDNPVLMTMELVLEALDGG